MIKIASIDVGSKHLAILFLKIVNDNIEIEHTFLCSPGVNCLQDLKKMETYFDACNVIVIERQMSINKKALMIQQQLLTFFEIIYSNFKKVVLFDSRKKTNLLSDVPLLTYNDRKKFTIKYAIEHDVKFINGFKKDDIADAFCQAIAFLIENELYKK